MKVLVIEDYLPLIQSLQEGFALQKFTVDYAQDGEEGLWYAQNNCYDVILLDLMLPKLDGFQVLKTLRKQDNSTPVLILTARGELDNKIKGLNWGGDDYLVKPFSFRELVSRMHALVRRCHQVTQDELQVEDLQIVISTRSVKHKGQSIALSRKEYEILEYLALRKNRVVSRDEIRDHLYSFEDEVASNVIDVYIGQLRRKVDPGPEPKLIHTVRGHGYLLGSLPE